MDYLPTSADNEESSTTFKVVPPPPSYTETTGDQMPSANSVPMTGGTSSSNCTSSQSSQSYYSSANHPNSTQIVIPSSNHGNSQSQFPSGMILPSIGGHIFPPVLQQQAEPTVNAAHACQKCVMPNNHNSDRARKVPISSEDFRWCMNRLFCLFILVIILLFIFLCTKPFTRW